MVIAKKVLVRDGREKYIMSKEEKVKDSLL